MVTVTPCKQCVGLGEVTFTREGGGPTCPHCGGSGYLTPDVLSKYIGSILDYPSCYMGGPSRRSMQKAKKIVEFLQHEGIIPLIPAENTSQPEPSRQDRT